MKREREDERRIEKEEGRRTEYEESMMVMRDGGKREEQPKD